MNITIACALRWGVASVRVYSTGHDSPFMKKHFRCREYIGGPRSLETAIVKKVGLWLCSHFCKDVWNKLVLACIFCIRVL